MQNIPTKVPGDTHFSTEFNSYVGEDKNLVTDVNITLDSGDSHQLGQSSAAYATTGDFFVDSGVANALVLGSSQYNFQTPQEYYNGMKVRTRPAATNTGPSAMNVAGLGNKFIKLTGGTLDTPAGYIVQGLMTEFYYDLSNDCMILLGSDEESPTVPYNYFSPGGFQTVFTATTLSFGPGACSSYDNTQMMINTINFVKDFTLPWAPGNGSGGTPSTIILAADTPYYDFIISKPDGTIDFGLDTSIIAANLLSDASAFGFTRYRRIMGHLTNAGDTNIKLMYQIGRDFYYQLYAVDYSTTSNSSLNPIITLSVPSFPCYAIIHCPTVNEDDGTSRGALDIYEEATSKSRQNIGTQPTYNSSANGTLRKTIFTDTRNIQLNAQATDGSRVLNLYCVGWHDPLI